MNSEIKIFERENGEIQRVQKVSWDDWSQLDFLWLRQADLTQQKKALECFYDIYRLFLIPTMPQAFPQMVMFTLPEELYGVVAECAGMKRREMEERDRYKHEKYGEISDPLSIATILLQDGIRIKKEQPIFLNAQAERLYLELKERGCVHIVCGKLPQTKMIPIGRFAGYLSETEPDAAMKVNANFFIMDPFDCASIYDQVGTPFGLCVKSGVVENPPLYGREALLIGRDGTTSIHPIDVRDLEIEIGGVRYKHGDNATIYTRPENAKTPKDARTKLVIIGRQVVAVKSGGSVSIPASGFVLCLESKQGTMGQVIHCGGQTIPCVDLTQSQNMSFIYPGDAVTYHGLSDVEFGVQVGNSIIRDGKKTEEFLSSFYNIYKLQRVPYPPSLYPMDFEKARAARMAIGADAAGKPILFWAEGKGKLCYVPGEDSTGASLSEMAEIAKDLGIWNAVNLDGGGSAQILVEGMRALHISDRKKEDNSDAERLVPLGLIVR